MRSLKVTTRNIRRSPFQSFAAVSVLTLTFFVVSIFIIVAYTTSAILSHFETRPQLIAYLQEDIKIDQIEALKNQLVSTQKAASVKYVSKDEALTIYQESVGNDPLLLGTVTNLSLVTADVLPASLEVSVYNPDDFPELVEIIKASDIVATNIKGEKDIDFPQSVVEQLTAWTKGIRLSGLVLIIALSLSSIITIVIILGMKISGKKTEIATMKLLGAGKKFIIFPYLYESLFYTISGSFFGWLFGYIALLYATPFLVTRLSGIIDLPVSPILMLILLGALFILAVFLGLISGFLAIGRFIRRK